MASFDLAGFLDQIMRHFRQHRRFVVPNSFLPVFPKTVGERSSRRDRFMNPRRPLSSRVNL